MTVSSWVRALIATLLLSGCAAQVRRNVFVVGQSFADMKREQLMGNIARFWDNPYTLPSQFELQAATLQANNSVTTGIAPNIALRAIAITGIKLEDANAFNQQIGLLPVTSVSDLRLLQRLYQYAVPAGPGHKTFDDLVNDLRRLATGLEKPVSSSNDPDLITILIRLIEPLPNGPLTGSGRECVDNETAMTVSQRLVCFLPGNASGVDLSANEVMSRYTLWMSGLTQDIVLHKLPQEAPTAAGDTDQRRPGRRSPPSRPSSPSASVAVPPTNEVPSQGYSVRRRLETLVPTPFVVSPQ